MDKMEEIKEITIYTDGACDPNPGPGGYGVVLIYGTHRKELSGAFRLTTNNRMEIYAAIAGLQVLKEPCKVKVYSDSEYLVRAMTEGWVHRWQEKDWRRRKNAPAANRDLWEILLELCEKHQVEFKWVRGHAGNHENERCDQLSVRALQEKELATDEGYAKQSKPLIRQKRLFSFSEPQSYQKTKITQEGQPCRKCSTPVIKRIPRRKRKENQLYYFEYYLYCPNCHTMYMVEEAKRYIEPGRNCPGG